MNIELAKQIEKSSEEIKKTFNEYLENFLQSTEGYKELNDNGKSIAKIFTCINILINLEKLNK